MTDLAKLFEASQDRLIKNAKTMMENAQHQWFRDYWEKVYLHLLKQYDRLN